MEGFFGSLAGQGVNSIGMFLNWPYIIIFVILAYSVNKAVKARVKLRKEQGKPVKKRMRTFVRSLLIGIALAIFFFWMNRQYNTVEILRYIVSLIVTTFVLWGGIKNMITEAKRNWQAIKQTLNGSIKDEA